MKKAFLLFLVIGVPISLMAQLQRTLPVNIQTPPQPDLQQKETLASVKGTVAQDFETFTDFSLVFSPWSTTDVDGSTTYGITDVTFLHSGEAMSFIVFNPASTTPSLAGDQALQPHGGNKFAACFASTSPPNNDWIISPQIQLGSNGTLKFWVKSYTSEWGLERYKVGVSTTNPNPGSFTFISGGAYLEAPATAWEQKDFDLSAYNGMQIYIGIQCVSDNAFIFMLDDIEITSGGGGGTATLTGMVTDAINGNPIPNALVSVGGLSDLTDASGNYTITNIPAGVLNANFTATPTSGNAPLAVQFTDLSAEGTHTVTASATGYTNYTNSQVVIPEGGTLELQISLSPTLATGQYRFVLTWGESPTDLDSHLKTPSIEGSTYHIYYNYKGSADSPPYAILDIDDVTSFGPETTTIYDLYPGEYHYYIYNYSGSPEIITSSAVVQIFDDNGLLHTLQVPTTGTGRYWDICTMNGSNGNISIINQITETEPGGLPYLTPDQLKKKPLPAGRNIVSWNWNFGDGGSSTVQNPSHTYAANGSYSVSLTVSDGVNNKTETKNAFITVGGGGTSTLTGMVTDAINGNPIPNALVSVAGLSDLTDANGNYTITNIPAGVLNANFTATPTNGNAPLAVQFTDLSAEGTHTVTASATGYTNYTNSQVVIPESGTLELQIALSPTLATGQYRFVLTWGESPTDLDSHLKTPSIEGSTYHIYYNNKGSADSPPYAILDIDDVTSFGPETTTIYDLYPGEYHYYIYNFSGSPEITTSSAVVQIFDDNGLLHTLQVPTTGTGLYWDICTMNGSNGNISIINQITEIEPGGLPYLTPDQLKKKPIPADRNIVSWNWNFGDGGSSTVQNPSHTYAANGSYSVSLTVSDGVNNKTETKNAYIIVGPYGVDEAAWEKDISIYPNPAKDQLHISSGIRIESVALFDINGQQKMWTDDCGNNYSVNLSSFQDGTYILRIITEKGSVQRKLNIQR
ncbi:MAG: PKD domain-containing protein [Bacteroidetes bacterium]|nr:PKD domain-containing protein [Bacteroidota bacterium]